jgi:diaminopimelate epimerase
VRVYLRYADPAGNVTAVVESPVLPHQRPAVAKAILDLGRAEQVGFVTEPRQGGAGRLEMMGGEFCGNAARSFGYLLAQEHGLPLPCILPVEISGAKSPVSVTVEQGRATAQMPLPTGLSRVRVLDREYPVVRCPGICHLLAQGLSPSRPFVQEALKALKLLGFPAMGVMFLEQDQLTPAVYVQATDSLVWESSCGSGSAAAAWFLAQDAATRHFTFHEPGGTLEVYVEKQSHQIIALRMGGALSLAPEEPLDLPDLPDALDVPDAQETSDTQ